MSVVISLNLLNNLHAMNRLWAQSSILRCAYAICSRNVRLLQKLPKTQPNKCAALNALSCNVSSSIIKLILHILVSVEVDI